MQTPGYWAWGFCCIYNKIESQEHYLFQIIEYPLTIWRKVY